jgi:homoserine acetyltransferase
MNAIESTVQLQIRMPSSMRQAVKIEAAMREVRVCRFVQEAIREKIARDRALSAGRAGTDPAAVSW